MDMCLLRLGLMTTSYFIVGVQSTPTMEGRETSKFPPLISNVVPNSTSASTSNVPPVAAALLPTTNIMANAALYGMHPAASLLPSLYMQNLIIQYHKLISEYPTNLNLENTRQLQPSNLNQFSPLIISNLMSSMAGKGTCVSIPKKPVDETPLDLCTKRTPSPLNLNSIDGGSRRSPPSSPSYDISPSTPTSLITSVSSKPKIIWSPASSCEEEENAKKFFNIKNNNTFHSSEISTSFLTDQPNQPSSPNSLTPNFTSLNPSSIPRNMLSNISSPSLNHLGQIGEFSFNSSPQSTATTSSPSSMTSHATISHHSGDEHGTKKPRIFKVHIIHIFFILMFSLITRCDGIKHITTDNLLFSSKSTNHTPSRIPKDQN